jgi:hypothetical protein
MTGGRDHLSDLNGMTGEGAKLWVLGEICLFRNVTCAHLGGRGIPRHTYPLLITVGGGGGGRRSEPVFVNVYGAQESIPRNRFRPPMQPFWPVQK